MNGVKHYEDMLKIIDRKIDRLRNEIMQRQLAIARLEDTHKELHHMAEEDMMEAAQQHLVREAERPLLIARRVTPEAAPEAPTDLIKTGKRRGLPRLRASRKKATTTARALMDKVLQTLAGSEPLTKTEIAGYLGVVSTPEKRKQFENSVYRLLKAGKLHRDEETMRYSLAQ